MTLYRLNPKNDFIFKVFELFELRKREEFFRGNETLSRRLRKYMQILQRHSENDPQIVVLYGPAARGDWAEGHKADILTVTPSRIDPKEIEKIHRTAASRVKLMLDIASRNLTVKSFVQGFRTKNRFFIDLWRDRIVLYNEFLFWQGIRESKTKIKSLIL